MDRGDVLRLALPFHPWKHVSEGTVSVLRHNYESLIEAEKLYVYEVERILERVATRSK